MSQWDYQIEQPIPGPFLFPNSIKGPGIEVEALFFEMELLFLKWRHYVFKCDFFKLRQYFLKESGFFPVSDVEGKKSRVDVIEKSEGRG